METFRMDGDNNRIYFRNYYRVSDDEEYENIMEIIKGSDCTIGDTLRGPDCDIIHCEYEGILFNVVRTVDGDGSFIYCEDERDTDQIEELFIE